MQIRSDLLTFSRKVANMQINRHTNKQRQLHILLRGGNNGWKHCDHKKTSSYSHRWHSVQDKALTFENQRQLKMNIKPKVKCVSLDSDDHPSLRHCGVSTILTSVKTYLFTYLKSTISNNELFMNMHTV